MRLRSGISWLYLLAHVLCRGVSQSLLAQLKPGMTTNEVAAILGPPTSTSPGKWYYQRFLMVNVGVVELS